MQDLISAKFALENLFSKPNTVFLDATFHLPNSGRNALNEFNKEHIPNSRFFDIDKKNELLVSGTIQIVAVNKEFKVKRINKILNSEFFQNK